jgi:hypothetical protein
MRVAGYVYAVARVSDVSIINVRGRWEECRYIEILYDNEACLIDGKLAPRAVSIGAGMRTTGVLSI